HLGQPRQLNAEIEHVQKVRVAEQKEPWRLHRQAMVVFVISRRIAFNVVEANDIHDDVDLEAATNKQADEVRHLPGVDARLADVGNEKSPGPLRIQPGPRTVAEPVADILDTMPESKAVADKTNPLHSRGNLLQERTGIAETGVIGH